MFTFRDDKYFHLKFKPDKRFTTIERMDKRDLFDEGKSPEEVAVDMFQRVCVKKNVEVQLLVLMNVTNFENYLALKFQKMFTDSETLLRLATLRLDCMRKSQHLFDVLLNNCQPAHLKNVQVRGNSDGLVDLFPKHRDILAVIEKLKVPTEVSATDEDVLAMKARKIHLMSKEFTSGMMEKMLKKLMDGGVLDSFFVLKNPNGDLVHTNFRKNFEKQKTSDNVTTFIKRLPAEKKRVLLATSPYGMLAKVQSIDTASKECRESCLNRSECDCYNDFWPYEDSDDEDDVYEREDYESEEEMWSDEDDGSEHSSSGSLDD